MIAQEEYTTAQTLALQTDRILQQQRQIETLQRQLAAALKQLEATRRRLAFRVVNGNGND